VKHRIPRRAILTGSAALAATLAAPRASGAAAAEPGPVRLFANENPYGPAESARQAMGDALYRGWRYAGGEEGRLAELIARREGVGTDHVALAAGSSEVLRLAVIAYGRQGGRVVAARPTFSFLPRYAVRMGCDLDEVPLDSAMVHDLDAMAARVTEDTRLIYVCNPNNPTGTVLDAQRLRDFITAVSSRAPVVVDEAYVDLIGDPLRDSMVDQVRSGKPVIISRTFSKIHGLAGLRVGYAIAPPAMIRRLKAMRVTMPNVVSLAAATASYRDEAFQRFSRRKIRQCQAVVSGAFDELGVPYTPSAANFVLFDTGGSVDAFRQHMREHNMLVGRSYAPYATWCRVSMGTVEQMERFVAVAKAYFPPVGQQQNL
jgi:histidinol-phosphate aminotransferase